MNPAAARRRPSLWVCRSCLHTNGDLNAISGLGLENSFSNTWRHRFSVRLIEGMALGASLNEGRIDELRTFRLAEEKLFGEPGLPGALGPAIIATRLERFAFCVHLAAAKHRTVRQCRALVPQLLGEIRKLKEARFSALVTLGEILEDWQEEIARMWRYTKNNGITEGFLTKKEMVQRRAYGFRNFENYRLRVRSLCGG